VVPTELDAGWFPKWYERGGEENSSYPSWESNPGVHPVISVRITMVKFLFHCCVVRGEVGFSMGDRGQV